MKNFLRSAFSILMAMIVLVTGTGFTIKKMVCLSTGQTEVSIYSFSGECCEAEEIYAEESCCEESCTAEENTMQLGSKCCDYSSQIFYLAQDVVLKQASVEKTVYDIVKYAPAGSPYIYSFAPRSSYPLFTDPPPPLSGRDRLQLTGTLLI